MRDLQTARGAPLIDSIDESQPDPVPVAAASPTRPPRRYAGWLAFVAAAVVAVDLATKVWVVEALGEGQDDVVSLLGGYLLLKQARNPGAAFGFARGGTIVFSVVACVVIVVIIRTAKRLRSLPWAVVLGLLLGGATGNLVDRVLRSPGFLRGEVVDWINFGPDKFPLFNAADSAIVVGGALAVLLAVRGVDLAPRAAAPGGSGGHVPGIGRPDESGPLASPHDASDTDLDASTADGRKGD